MAKKQTKIEREFTLWEEGGVVSFGELIPGTTNTVINPCVITCNREEEEITDPADGLKKKRHVMHTEMFAYVYNAIYMQDTPPIWKISPNVTVLERGAKFNPSLIEMYDNYINSISIKKK